MDPIAEIKSKMKENKLLIGTETTMKAIKAGKLSKVFVASNSSPGLNGDLEHYAKPAGIQIVKLEIANDELGVVCKKNFRISIIGLLK